MKNSREAIPVHFKELCRAICAIVHANINDNRFFYQSVTKSRIPALRKFSFADNGVICELDEENVKIKLFVTTIVGEHSIYHNAMELQHRIAEEILLFTSLLPEEIDVIITGIKVKKTQ
ncbi:hypothetical protein [Mesobacillus jeotgali]|uniref:hypothetical protein n=1 Tax=Mesobacillus jeotgali TaxID=129985 RepID=UPI0009A677E3|nr:hypothetical protein [Mesobacillus jeotgali]